MSCFQSRKLWRVWRFALICCWEHCTLLWNGCQAEEQSVNDGSVSVVQVTVWCEMVWVFPGGNQREFQDEEISQKTRRWEVRNGSFRGKKTFPAEVLQPTHQHGSSGHLIAGNSVQSSLMPLECSSINHNSPFHCPTMRIPDQNAANLSVRPQSNIRLKKEQ